MGDENPRRTLGDYSRPSHEGYRNTIEVPNGNDLAPLRSDTIRLVQNGCSFHGLRSEDPNQHLKDFLKIMDSIDLNVETRERTRLHLFQLSLRDQASNRLERLLAGSISTWKDLTTRFLALLEDLALYDNESWNDPRDFAKPVKDISLPNDVPMVLMTLNIAWKILGKLMLITRLREATEWEASHSLLIKGQEPLTKLPMLGKTNQTLVGNVPKLSRARNGD
ncbi:hypothetical protein Tco_0760198 [Tanacetum coccineum]